MPDPTRTRQEAEALGLRNNEQLRQLKYNWSDAYDIDIQYPHAWSARRRDDGAVLEADSADALRRMIVEDYGRRPVPRHGDISDD